MTEVAWIVSSAAAVIAAVVVAALWLPARIRRR